MKKSFFAKLGRLLGALLVLSAGYFIYLDNEMQYTNAKITSYDTQYPIIRFNASGNQQITYKMQEHFNEQKYPIGSDLQVRYPKDDYSQLEYVSPFIQWGFYIVLFIGLIIFFVGAVLTIQVKKENYIKRNETKNK